LSPNANGKASQLNTYFKINYSDRMLHQKCKNLSSLGFSVEEGDEVSKSGIAYGYRLKGHDYLVFDRKRDRIATILVVKGSVKPHNNFFRRCTCDSFPIDGGNRILGLKRGLRGHEGTELGSIVLIPNPPFLSFSQPGHENCRVVVFKAVQLHFWRICKRYCLETSKL
jgi:hypothetical protein